MALQIKKSKDATSDGVSMVIYSEAGVGKTSTLATLPGKTLLLNAENGTLVLKDFDIDIIDITGGLVSEVTDVTPATPDETISKMEHLWYVFDLIESGELKYDNIALDSITEVSDWIEANLAADPYYGDPKNTFKYWKEFKNRLYNLLKAFRDLKGVNIIILALEAQTEKNGMIVTKPSVASKEAKDKFVSFFDEVLYLDSDVDGVRHFVTTTNAEVVAKSRSNLDPITSTTDLGVLYFNQKATKGYIGNKAEVKE